MYLGVIKQSFVHNMQQRAAANDRQSQVKLCLLILALSVQSRLLERLRVNIFFFNSDAVSSLGLSHVLFSSPHSPPSRSSLSSRVKNINTSPAKGSFSTRGKLVDNLYFTYLVYSKLTFLSVCRASVGRLVGSVDWLFGREGSCPFMLLSEDQHCSPEVILPFCQLSQPPK